MDKPLFVVPRERPQSIFNTCSQSLKDFVDHLPDDNEFIYRHQKEALIKANSMLRSTSDVALIVLPTGTGKTGLAVLAAYYFNATKVLVVTPSFTIAEQIDMNFSDKSSAFLIERGIVPGESALNVLPPHGLVKKTCEINNLIRNPVMEMNVHKVSTNSSVGVDAIPRDQFDFVIVDEAHHYPQPMWKKLVDHFDKSKRLFLTATPFYKEKPILPNPPGVCFSLTREEAVSRGTIRDLGFDEVPSESLSDEDVFSAISRRVVELLDEHNNADNFRHKAMVLCQSCEGNINPVYRFAECFRRSTGRDCVVFVQGTSNDEKKRFESDDGPDVLVVVDRLREGYDNKKVSVVAIARNVAPASRVLFAQFVGRAVRKLYADETIKAWIVSHHRFNQRRNWECFDKLQQIINESETWEFQPDDPTELIVHNEAEYLSLKKARLDINRAVRNFTGVQKKTIRKFSKEK